MNEPLASRRPLPRWIVVFILVGAGAVALWNWQQGAEERALKKLPADERGLIFSREFKNLETLCGEGQSKEGLSKRCEDLAEFVMKFPECDEACKTLARRQIPRATR